MSIFEDTFTVSSVDPDGKVFERGTRKNFVSRVVGTTEALNMNLVLDVNCELFPLAKGQKVNFIVTKNIKLDGSAPSTTAAASFNPNEGPSLADKFEYVCYGQVYKLEEIPGGKMALYVSFGGLIFRIESNPRYLTDVTNGSFLYLLMNKL